MVREISSSDINRLLKHISLVKEKTETDRRSNQDDQDGNEKSNPVTPARIVGDTILFGAAVEEGVLSLDGELGSYR